MIRIAVTMGTKARKVGATAVSVFGEGGMATLIDVPCSRLLLTLEALGACGRQTCLLK